MQHKALPNYFPLLLLSFIMAVSGAFAQAYHPFPDSGGHTYTYRKDQSNYDWLFAAKSIRTIAEGQDSAYYFYRIDRAMLPTEVRVGCLQNTYTAGSIARFVMDEDHYFGKKMLYQPDGTCLFISSAADTFRLQTLAGIANPWTWQGSVTAQVDSIVVQSVLGLPDSVKHISLSDGRRILLSKRRGFVEVFPILPFPYSGPNGPVVFTLSGLQGQGIGLNPPTFDGYFQLQAGDRMGYLSTQSSSGLGAVYLQTFERSEVISMVQGSHFYYTVESEKYEYSHIPAYQIYDTTYSFQTLSLAYTTSNFWYVGTQPFERDTLAHPMNPQVSLGMYEWPIGSGRIRVDYHDCMVLDTCSKVAELGNSGYENSYSFTEGLGITHERHTQPSSNRNRTITCFQTASGSYGDCSPLLLGIAPHSFNPDPLELKVSPVPCSDQLTVTIPGNDSKAVYLALYSQEGKTLQELRGVGPSVEMDLSDLNPGLYLLRLEKPGKPVTFKKVLVAR